MAERPTLITIIGGLTILFAIVLLLLGAGIMVIPEGTMLDLWNDYAELHDNFTFDSFKSLMSLVGVGVIAVGLFNLLVGVALLRGWTIAWYLGVILYAIEFVLSLVTIFTIASVVSLVISAVILYYLFRPKVKEFFGV